ncbi:Uncharacterised protein [Salmonella enterica subsp. enterica]|uniref:Uncharacterized protein n=1 Tax=Salmonella enterica I TaxID=59201 RepID=A0A379VST3_SALET|nr:Uncharacterised protein [Salmonella enterica subsp. enterica]
MLELVVVKQHCRIDTDLRVMMLCWRFTQVRQPGMSRHGRAARSMKMKAAQATQKILTRFSSMMMLRRPCYC